MCKFTLSTDKFRKRKKENEKLMRCSRVHWQRKKSFYCSQFSIVIENYASIWETSQLLTGTIVYLVIVLKALRMQLAIHRQSPTYNGSNSWFFTFEMGWKTVHTPWSHIYEFGLFWAGDWLSLTMVYSNQSHPPEPQNKQPCSAGVTPCLGLQSQ